jgi:hypothetical protein
VIRRKKDESETVRVSFEMRKQVARGGETVVWGGMHDRSVVATCSLKTMGEGVSAGDVKVVWEW